MSSKWLVVWIILLADGSYRLKNVEQDFVIERPQSAEVDTILAGRDTCLYKIFYDAQEDIVHYIKELYFK